MNKQLELLERLNKNDSLDTIQNYIKEVIEIRGFSNHSIEQEFLLLTEEVGELSKSIRKEKYAIDKSKVDHYDTVSSEIADVFIVLTSICNALNINLFEAVVNKEKENIKRSWSKMTEE